MALPHSRCYKAGNWLWSHAMHKQDYLQKRQHHISPWRHTYTVKFVGGNHWQIMGTVTPNMWRTVNGCCLLHKGDIRECHRQDEKFSWRGTYSIALIPYLSDANNTSSCCLLLDFSCKDTKRELIDIIKYRKIHFLASKDYLSIHFITSPCSKNQSQHPYRFVSTMIEFAVKGRFTCRSESAFLHHTSRSRVAEEMSADERLYVGCIADMRYQQ